MPKLLVLLAVFGIGGIAVLAQIPVVRQYDDNVAGVQLAKGGDDDSDSSSSSSSSSESSGSSGSSSSSSDSSGSNNGSSNSGSSSSDSGEASKTEIRSTTGDRVKAELKGNRIKSEVRQGTLRLEYEVKAGEVKLKVKNRSGEVEDEDDIAEIEDELEDNDLKVATSSSQVAIVHKQSGAVSKFPLSLNLVNQTLTVTTPTGVKTVVVLPDQAISNLLASKVMTDVESVQADGELASVNQLVELEERDGKLVYKVNGVRAHRLLGLLSINTPLTAIVSADDGQVIETQQSLLGRILNRIAP